MGEWVLKRGGGGTVGVGLKGLRSRGLFCVPPGERRRLPIWKAKQEGTANPGRGKEIEKGLKFQSLLN